MDSRQSRDGEQLATEIEKVADAIYNQNAYRSRELSAIAAKVAKLETSAVSEMAWISVDDRLPTKENEMCIIGNDGTPYALLPWKLDQHGNGAGWMDLMEGVLYGPKDVTHWLPVPMMPLPKAPQGERDGGA